MKHPILLLIIIAFFCSCGNNKQESKQPSSTSPDTSIKAATAPAPTDGISQQDSVKATGRQVLVFLKARNYTELIKYFSNDGVFFSSYGYLDTTKSKKLTPSDFLESIAKNWVLTWGNLDGTGEPIKLTVKNYLKKFVYNADYLNAEAVGYDEIIKKGNTQINLETVYPNHHFIDYHFSGFDQKNEGMDWTSLKLVFEKQDGQYFLVAIIHDQWTI
jgi:hypothetical protein